MHSVEELKMVAESLIACERATALAEEKLKQAKEQERVIREETLPGMMQEIGMKEFVLETGEKVKLSQEVYAAIPADKKYEAFEWLDTNGFGGLIKTDVVVAFTRGELEKAQEFYSELIEKGVSPSLTQNVHAQTLKAFLKEQLADGKEIPLDLFGARPVFAAKISKK